MEWTEPQYSRSRVKREGDWLRNQPLPVNTEVLKNWRSAHQYPQHHFYVLLSQRARKVNANSFVSQRLKRLSSIHAKLRREPTMQLNTMQDIAGCRAVLPTVADVRKLVSVYMHGDMKHEFDHEKDYIRNPKGSGYRSHHLVYRYKSDVKTAYEDLRVEIQLRSQLQHAWATALETIDLFTRQALKASQGIEAWERFFILMGSALAQKERTPRGSGIPKRKELVEEIRHLNIELGVLEKMKTYRAFRRVLGFDELKKHSMVLLCTSVNDEGKGTIHVNGYEEWEIEKAHEDYYAEEAKRRGEVVLVAANRARNVRRSFPNFFADTLVFVREAQIIIEGVR